MATDGHEDSNWTLSKHPMVEHLLYAVLDLRDTAMKEIYPVPSGGKDARRNENKFEE